MAKISLEIEVVPAGGKSSVLEVSVDAKAKLGDALRGAGLDPTRMDIRVNGKEVTDLDALIGGADKVRVAVIERVQES